MMRNGRTEIQRWCRPQLRKYQEQSHLLDPLLEDLVTPLASRLRSFADDGSNADLQAVQGLSHLLWAVVTVRCDACRYKSFFTLAGYIFNRSQDRNQIQTQFRDENEVH